jgi:hypothetical protein
VSDYELPAGFQLLLSLVAGSKKGEMVTGGGLHLFIYLVVYICPARSQC